MPPRDEETTKILIQIAGDIGETKSGINHLKDNVDSLTEDFKDVKEQLTQTVKHPECTQRHVIVAQSLDAMKKELVAEIKKSTTGMSHLAITPAMLNKTPDHPPTLQEIEKTLEARKEEKTDKKRRAALFWLTAISVSTGLLSGCAIGIYKLVTFMGKLEEAVSANTQEMKSELKKTQKVVYVLPNTSVDAGMEPPKKVVGKKVR